MISGAALGVQQFAEHMALRGHRVVVLAASECKRPYVREESGVKVIRLKSWANRLRVNQTFVPFSREKIIGELRGFQPDVIHSHDPLLMGWPALLYGNRNQIPVAFTAHALPWTVSATVRVLRPIRKLIEVIFWTYGRWYLNRCSTVIAPSEAIAAILRTRTDRPVVYISNPVDTGVFRREPDLDSERDRLCQRFGLAPDLPVILTVSRLDADKNVQVVVQAAIKVMESTPAQVLVVGDGTQKQQLIRQADVSGFGQRFHFPGFVAQDSDLPGLYRLASVFVTASEIETQGIALLEAAASALPLVAVQAECFEEIIQEGVSGYMVPRNDVDQLCDRITRLLKYPELAREMGSAARSFSAQHPAQTALDKYESLIQRISEAGPDSGIEI
ncbi:MAG: glycosyltransferase [Anaerolineales bacterium]